MDTPQEPSKLQQLKATLAARGLAPRKTFGQNFMVDPNFAAAVARDAGADERTLLIEIGPGTGCLTEALLASHPSARVLAVEIDRGLASLLREAFAGFLASGRMTLVEGDALAGKHGLNEEWVRAAQAIAATEGRPRLVLCSNLPYNAATPLLANLALETAGLVVERAIATVQLELAERILAKPGESAYGALSALMQLRADGRIARKVGGGVFWPRPQVDSAVLDLRYRPWDMPGGLTRQEAPAFQALLQQLFGARRKTLRAVLKPRPCPTLPGVTPDSRAEDLSPEVLLALFRALG